MAINVSFNGATIYKPGSYSKTSVDLGGGFPLGAAGLVAIFGEADAGTPGDSEADIGRNFFTADQIPAIRAKYRSGPIVDALTFLFSPASDAAIPSGASTVWVYKTNASVQASMTTAFADIYAQEWGVGGNRISVTNVLVNETPATVTGSVVLTGADVASTQMLVIYVNGVQTTVTIAASASPAALATALTTAFTGLTFTLDGSNHLVVTMATNVNAYKLGYSRNFYIDPSSTSLTALGLTAGLVQPAVEPSCTITLNQRRDNVQESDVLGGNVVLYIGYHSGTATTASVAIDATTVTLKSTDATVTLQKSAYVTLQDLASDIDLRSGWNCTVASPLYNSLPLSALDQVTVGALGPANSNVAHIKKDVKEVTDFYNSSLLCTATILATHGLPDALIETLLSGGLRGATNTAACVSALDKFTKFHVNSVVPLFSRDATDDITDGLTDSASNYTIDGVHQAVKTHVSLMKSTKKRSERQMYLSLKKSFLNCQNTAGSIGDARAQLLIQDVRQTNSQGAIQWFQPWALACMFAGARGGAPVGLPMTFKFLNVSGIRHTAQPMTTAEEDITIDFDPDTMYEAAIQSGITFLEAPQTGGYRCVVDNTTYGTDDNWVWNRANVIYASDIIAFNLRNRLETAFVGQKNTISASTISSYTASVLNQFLSQGITVSTSDAPNGYKQLQVSLQGNTIYVTVVLKLVEGIDFVLSDIMVQRASA